MKDIINALPLSAKLVALRTIANTAMAQWTNQRMRELAPVTANVPRGTDDSVLSTMGEAGSLLQELLAKEAAQYVSQVSAQIPEQRALSLHLSAKNEVNKSATSQYDKAMGIAQWLKFLVQGAQTLKPEELQVFSEVTGLDSNTLANFDRAAQEAEIKRLSNCIPALITEYESSDVPSAGDWDEQSLDDLDLFTQYKLLIKVHNKLKQEAERLINVALRQRRLELLAKAQELKTGHEGLRAAITGFETKYADEVAGFDPNSLPVLV